MTLTTAQKRLSRLLMQETVLSESRGVLKFFPGASVLRSAEFRDLRAPGAFIVSGVLKDFKIQQIKLRSEAGATLRFANPGMFEWVVSGTDGQIVYSGCEKTVTLKTQRNGVYILRIKTQESCFAG